MVGQDGGVRVGKAECKQTPYDFVGAQAGTSGSDLTMPTPRSRFIAAIDSARPVIARETSSSGAASTIGSPSSAKAPSRGSNGVRASRGAPTSAANASPPPVPNSSSRSPPLRDRYDM